MPCPFPGEYTHPVIHEVVRYPNHLLMGEGIPRPGQDRGTPSPVRTKWGVPPPIGRWIGLPFLPPGRQGRRASTCYAVGGMSLLFTQEDFLVVSNSCKIHTLISTIVKPIVEIRVVYFRNSTKMDTINGRYAYWKSLFKFYSDFK